MSAIAQRYQGKVKLIHINVDAPEAASALQKYNVRGTPTTVLIDRHGRVSSNVPGWPGEESVAKILDLLVAQK